MRFFDMLLLWLAAVAVLMTICVAFTGCSNRPARADQAGALAACEGALVSLEAESRPAPVPAPDDAAGTPPVTGPLDTLRDARELIQKGNALADRTKRLMGAAQREGGLWLFARMPGGPAPVPKASPGAPADCPEGTCPLLPVPENAQKPAPAAARGRDPPARCPEGACYAPLPRAGRRFLFRFRR